MTRTNTVARAAVNYSKWRKAELQARLREKGLELHGVVHDLLSRLSIDDLRLGNNANYPEIFERGRGLWRMTRKELQDLATRHGLEPEGIKIDLVYQILAHEAELDSVKENGCKHNQHQGTQIQHTRPQHIQSQYTQPQYTYPQYTQPQHVQDDNHQETLKAEETHDEVPTVDPKTEQCQTELDLEPKGSNSLVVQVVLKLVDVGIVAGPVISGLIEIVVRH